MRWRWQQHLFEVDLLEHDQDALTARVNGQEVRVRVLAVDGHAVVLDVDGRRVRVYLYREGRDLWLAVDGRTWRLTPAARREAQAASTGAAGGDGRLRAPVPAQVREIRVQPGDRVQPGQVVAVLEAMKMEFRLQAPFAGVVHAVAAQPGQVVERDQVVVEIRPETPQA